MRVRGYVSRLEDAMSLLIGTVNSCPLYCVWIETGNPALPLACVLIDSTMQDLETEACETAASDVDCRCSAM